MTTKLTLSVDSAIIAKARRISKHRRTSISAMFSHYIASLEDASSETPELPPITKRVLEMGAKLPTVPADWDYRSELGHFPDNYMPRVSPEEYRGILKCEDD